MQALSRKVLGRLQFNLEQVQDLTPTPMTLSSVMFYTGLNPYTMESLYVARSQDDKRRQKSYFFDENGAPQRGESPRGEAKHRAQGGKGGYKGSSRTSSQRGGRVERVQRDAKYGKKR